MTGSLPLRLWHREEFIRDDAGSHHVVERDRAARDDGSSAPSRPRILIIGTAPVLAVQACMSAHEGQGELLLLVPEKHQGSFWGPGVHRFSRTLSCQERLVRLLRDFAPDEAVVVVGQGYTHDNVVRLLTAYSALSGRALRSFLFSHGERLELADAACVAPPLRGPLVAPRVHLGNEAYFLSDDALPGALMAWSRSGKAGAGDLAYVDGLRFALHGDDYESAEQFYRWLCADRDHLTVILDPPRCDLCLGPEGRRELQSKIDLLDRLREALLAWPRAGEGIALAVSRILAREGRIPEAKARLAVQLTVSPTRHTLQDALHTVNLLVEGRAVPEHLSRFVGDEGTYLRDRICPAPFANFFVTSGGAVHVCCGHFLPTPIGNILESSTEQTLNSAVAQDIRRSIAEGTYKYCDLVKCSYIESGSLPLRSEVLALHEQGGDSLRLEAMVAAGDWRGLPSVANAARAVDGGRYDIASPANILFGLDLSCNLRCPSCRPGLWMENQQASDALFEVTRDRILPLAKKSVFFELNPSGELFASKVSLKALSLLNKQDYPTLQVNIISNGTLFTQERWDTLTSIHDMINSIRISVDASSKEVFERLRLGGQWDALFRNLRFISSLRSRNIAKRFSLSFTYQAENYQEMPAFVALAKSLQCDTVLFEQLQNMHWSKEEYACRAVNKKGHPDYERFRDVLRDPALQDQIVVLDFKEP